MRAPASVETMKAAGEVTTVSSAEWTNKDSECKIPWTNENVLSNAPNLGVLN
jgi:hypothetical protein